MSKHPLFDTFRRQIAENEAVLYMKGTPAMPMCGFSSAVVQMLKSLGVPFLGVDVLGDESVREQIKAFSDWPTIPQLYIKGEFIGGCDIVREMYQAGELQALLKEKNVTHAAA